MRDQRGDEVFAVGHVREVELTVDRLAGTHDGARIVEAEEHEDTLETCACRRRGDVVDDRRLDTGVAETLQRLPRFAATGVVEDLETRHARRVVRRRRRVNRRVDLHHNAHVAAARGASA